MPSEQSLGLDMLSKNNKIETAEKNTFELMRQKYLLFRVLYSLKFVEVACLFDCGSAMAFAACEKVNL